MAKLYYNFPEVFRLMREMREGDDDDDDGGQREYVAAIEAMNSAVTIYYGKKYRSYLVIDPKKRTQINKSLM